MFKIGDPVVLDLVWDLGPDSDLYPAFVNSTQHLIGTIISISPRTFPIEVQFVPRRDTMQFRAKELLIAYQQIKIWEIDK